jgi:hypothetical protein
MGANDQDTDGASSKKDFISKYSIVRKETKEIVDPHIQECHEIQMIISKIIENSKKSL